MTFKIEYDPQHDVTAFEAANARAEKAQAWVQRLLADAIHDKKVLFDLSKRAEETASRVAELEQGVRDIMKATVEGRVCDDVAWFDGITTLHDFCLHLLGAAADCQCVACAGESGGTDQN